MTTDETVVASVISAEYFVKTLPSAQRHNGDGFMFAYAQIE